MIHNPFKVGELVAGDPFCNRTKEINRIRNAFLDSQNIILISPRRWGKSSLVQEVIRLVDKNAIIITIDCFGITSSEQFLESYLTELLKASTTLYSKTADMVKKFASSISPYISYSYGPNEEIKFGINIPSKEFDPVVILTMASKIGKDKKLPVVVCVDEFQKISEWKDGEAFLEQLRSVWQRHTNVCYCLYGSKRHLMNKLFNDSSKPFFRFGENIFLERIPTPEWISFIQKQFTRTNKKVSKEVAQQIVELVQGHSYYVQYLSRLCWANTPRELTEAMLMESYEEYLNDHLAMFRKQTEGLTAYQVNYVKAVINQEKQFTSTHVLKTYKLGSPGNIKRIETSLQDSEIIDLFTGSVIFTEPFFETLFRRHFMRHS